MAVKNPTTYVTEYIPANIAGSTKTLNIPERGCATIQTVLLGNTSLPNMTMQVSDDGLEWRDFSYLTTSVSADNWIEIEVLHWNLVRFVIDPLTNTSGKIRWIVVIKENEHHKG